MYCFGFSNKRQQIALLKTVLKESSRRLEHESRATWFIVFIAVNKIRHSHGKVGLMLSQVSVYRQAENYLHIAVLHTPSCKVEIPLRRRNVVTLCRSDVD